MKIVVEGADEKREPEGLEQAISKLSSRIKEHGGSLRRPFIMAFDLKYAWELLRFHRCMPWLSDQEKRKYACAVTILYAALKRGAGRTVPVKAKPKRETEKSLVESLFGEGEKKSEKGEVTVEYVLGEYLQFLNGELAMAESNGEMKIIQEEDYRRIEKRLPKPVWEALMELCLLWQKEKDVSALETRQGNYNHYRKLRDILKERGILRRSKT